ALSASRIRRRCRGILQADVREEAGEERLLNAVRVDRAVAEREAEGFRQLAELADEVLPLANPQTVEVLVLAQAPECAGTEFLLLVLQIVPEVEQREEVARRIDEAGMLLVGLGPAFERAFPRVLDGEGGDDRHHLARDSMAFRFDDHPGEARVDRQPRKVPPDPRERRRPSLCHGDRIELPQEVDAVLDAARVRWLEERE